MAGKHLGHDNQFFPGSLRKGVSSKKKHLSGDNVEDGKGPECL